MPAAASAIDANGTAVVPVAILPLGRGRLAARGRPGGEPRAGYALR